MAVGKDRKIKVGNLRIGADFLGMKDWCVQVQSPVETLRFFIPGGTEEMAEAQARILADMIRNSKD